MNHPIISPKKSSIVTCGAVEEITWSKLIIQIPLSSGELFNLQVDSWKFQWSIQYKNSIVSNDTVNAIIVTHVHVDHVGNLVKEVAQNRFEWSIVMSQFSKNVVSEVLYDWYKIDQMNSQSEVINYTYVIKKYQEAYRLIKQYGLYSEDEQIKKIAKGMWAEHGKKYNFNHQSFVFNEWAYIKSEYDMESWLQRSTATLSKYQYMSPHELNQKLQESCESIGYTEWDILKTLQSCVWIDFFEPYVILNEWADKITVTLIDAWHSLGSAQCLVQHYISNKLHKSYFCSWDIGRIYDPFILKKPTLLHEYTKDIKLNFLAMEATYGDKMHQNQIVEQVQQLVTTINNAPWDIIIPLFSYQRWQDAQYLIHSSIDSWDIQSFGHGDVMVDWWLMLKFNRHFMMHNDQNAINPLYDHPYQKLQHYDKLILQQGNSKIYMPSWGMFQWGASQNYKERLFDPTATIILMWFQAPGTPGYDILKNRDQYPASIHYISFSGHADQKDLIYYYSNLVDYWFVWPKTKTLLRHGDTNAKNTLASLLDNKYWFNHKFWIPTKDFESKRI